MFLFVASETNLSVLDGFLSSIGGNGVKALLSPQLNQYNYYEYVSALLLATCQVMYPLY